MDCEKKRSIIKETASSRTIEESYDFLIASSGLSREWPSAPRSLSREEYLLEANQHIDHTESASDGVAIIGGGWWYLSL